MSGPSLRPGSGRPFRARFAGLCVAQACGALNDNLVKTAVLTTAIFDLHMRAAPLAALASILFIGPYAALSATFGLLADKFPKSTVARAAKLTELALLGVAAIGFARGDVALLVAVIAGLGLQAAVFSPVKYGLLPELLDEGELVRGNGYVEASTFVAILLGTMGGGALVVAPGGRTIVAGLGLALAAIGLAAACAIPRTEAAAPATVIGWNPWRHTRDIVADVRADRTSWRCILGISWFWMVGAILTNEFPIVVRDVLHASGMAQSLLLGAFSIGIGAGSLLCGRLLKDRASLVLAAPSLAGIAFFCGGFALVLAHSHEATPGLLSLFGTAHGVLMLASLLGIAACGGLFSVPLLAVLQSRAPHDRHARVISASNIVNAAFIVAGSAFTAVAGAIGLAVASVVALTAFASLAVLIAGMRPRLRDVARAAARAYFRCLHRARIAGLAHVAEAGPGAVVVANHVSWLDGILVGAFLPGRPVFALSVDQSRRFWFLRAVADILPVSPAQPMAARTMIDLVRSGRHLVIFPEGRISVTGGLMKIHDGAALIADKADAPVLPVRIDGLQFHKFSMMQGKLPLRWFAPVALTVLPARRLAAPPGLAGAARRGRLTGQVDTIMTEAAFRPEQCETTLFGALLDARGRFDPGPPVVADRALQEDGSVQVTELGYRRLILAAIILGRAIATRTAPGAPVGVLLPNAAGAAVTFFALQATARVAAMLNFSAGSANLVAACRMSAIGTVLTSRRFVAAGKLEAQVEALATVATIVYLEDLRAGITLADKLRGKLASFRPRRMRGARSAPDDVAAILFTSGSEGAPKGVALTHRNLLANCRQAGAMVDISPADRLFNAMPMFHSFGLTGGLLLPLFNGIRTFLYPSPLHYRQVPELVYAERSTIMFGTDNFLAGYARRADPADFQSLRYIFAGAEKLRLETRETFMRVFNTPIFEGYGATETAPVLALNTYRHSRVGTVGRLVPGIEARLAPVPGIGHGGSLQVRGPNVMKGYLREEAPGVIQKLPEGWYDTGDIVTIDADGFVTIVGRVRRFAKIAGEMVSMTAAEALASDLWPDARHAVVAVPDPRRGERLVLVTTEADAALRDLQRHARLRGMAELAVPRTILVQGEIPLLGTGKTDYPAVQAAVAATAVEPEGELEEA